MNKNNIEESVVYNKIIDLKMIWNDNINPKNVFDILELMASFLGYIWPVEGWKGPLSSEMAVLSHLYIKTNKSVTLKQLQTIKID